MPNIWALVRAASEAIRDEKYTPSYRNMTRYVIKLRIPQYMYRQIQGGGAR